MSQNRPVIGFHGIAVQDMLGRAFVGALQYVHDHPETTLHDFCVSQPDEEIEKHYPPWAGHVDGVLLVTGLRSGTVDWVLSGNVPAVNMSADIIDPRLPAVRVEPKSIARIATKHLRECGCTSLLHVGYRGSMGSFHRGNAFAEAARAAKSPVTCIEFVHLVDEFGPIQIGPVDVEPLDQALTQGPHPVGVLALNDEIARAVLNRITEIGLETPGDVAIVSVNDSLNAIRQRPTLTSVAYPGLTIGYRAMEVLVRQVRGGRCPRKPVGVPAASLAIRESTGGADARVHDVVRGMEWIERQGGAGVKVEDIAAGLSITRRSFERQFREQFQRSPGQEIQRRRLARAIDLLFRTEFSIGRISESLGFEEPTSFAKFFKKRTGSSPSAFRRRNGSATRQHNATCPADGECLHPERAGEVLRSRRLL